MVGGISRGWMIEGKRKRKRDLTRGGRKSPNRNAKYKIQDTREKDKQEEGQSSKFALPNLTLFLLRDDGLCWGILFSIKNNNDWKIRMKEDEIKSNQPTYPRIHPLSPE